MTSSADTLDSSTHVISPKQYPDPLLDLRLNIFSEAACRAQVRQARCFNFGDFPCELSMIHPRRSPSCLRV
jgi:hypothetical protein